MNSQFGIEFLEKVASEINSTGKWDAGSAAGESLMLVTDLCADLREIFGIDCHTDGRFITT